MHVKSVFPGPVDPMRWKRQSEPPAGSAGRMTAQTAPADAPSPAAEGSAFRQIVAPYRLTDISPRAFSEMLQKLHEAGAISDAEFQELSLIRLDLDLEGIGPDQSVDLLEVYGARLARLRREQEMFRDRAEPGAADQPSLAATQRRLEWLRRVAVVQSPQVGVGLDRTA